MVLRENTFFVAHLIATNFFGGPEKQIIEHLIRLNKGKFKGSIISYIENDEVNETLEIARDKNLNWIGIPMSNPFDIRALFKLIKALKKNQTKLLCTHGYKATVMGWIAVKMNKIPIIAFSRGYTDENIKISFYNWLERKFLTKVDGVVFVSKGQKNKLLSMSINPKRSWIIHNAISLKEESKIVNDNIKRKIFKNLGLINNNTKLIACVGRLSPEKGQKYLLEAAKMLTFSRDDFHIIFCGDGPERDNLLKITKKLGLKDYCHFLGFRKDMSDIYSAIDLLVLPSLSEGLPNVVLEAFYHKKPVIGTNVGGVPEIVIDNETGLLVDPGNVEMLKEAILKVLNSEKKTLEFGNLGYDFIKSNFNFELQFQKLDQMYKEMLET